MNKVHDISQIISQEQKKTNNTIIFMIIPLVILIIAVITYHIEYLAQKKIKYKKLTAKITSFNGSEIAPHTISLRKYYNGNMYSYKYTVNNKTYENKCTSKRTYNKNDEIEILYDENNPENSILQEQYNMFTPKLVIIGYIISALMLIPLIIYIMKNPHALSM